MNVQKTSSNSRTQAQRRAETRTLLMNTARDLFLSKGYDQTGMPELVKAAGLTRGALYHHFSDKADLFHALAKREAEEISRTIDKATRNVDDPNSAMEIGTNAYFEAMAVPGRATILLSIAPAVLGTEEAKALTASEGSAELRDGLKRALTGISDNELDALTDILSAAYDRAAQEIANGADQKTYVKALSLVIDQLLLPKKS
ncbi:MAG: TetR/AcrR family transcriptional regulator [Rhizobiaceae bacterium]|nr:TetR/AcrR family transcriptional regulator [Rhizobiaceae bacterium]